MLVVWIKLLNGILQVLFRYLNGLNEKENAYQQSNTL